MFLKWCREGRYSEVRTMKVDSRAEYKVDAERAAKSDEMYQLALSDLRID